MGWESWIERHVRVASSGASSRICPEPGSRSRAVCQIGMASLCPGHLPTHRDSFPHRELAAQRAQEEERHRTALVPIDCKFAEVRREHDGLFKPKVSMDDVLAREEYLAERERITREWMGEQGPIGAKVADAIPSALRGT